ncbi:MAG: AzlD domain-containing protein [Rhizobiales bacterium]|nr:AzlD domain-containing protein [Hyphomicrobiales bacterium]
MTDSASALIAIVMMGLIAFAFRTSGYLIGIQFKSIQRYRSLLEALPGCALMAILVPAAMKGSPLELGALACTLVVMWFSKNVLLSSIVGIGILLAGGVWLV